MDCDWFINSLLRSWHDFCWFESFTAHVGYSWMLVWSKKRSQRIYSSPCKYQFLSIDTSSPSCICWRGYQKSGSCSYVDLYVRSQFHSVGLCVCFVLCHAVFVTTALWSSLRPSIAFLEYKSAANKSQAIWMSKIALFCLTLEDILRHENLDYFLLNFQNSLASFPLCSANFGKKNFLW